MFFIQSLHRFCIAGCFALLLGLGGTAQAFDQARYLTLAKEAITEINALMRDPTGNHDQLLITLNTMIDIGLQACRAYQSHPDANQKLLTLVLEHGPSMTQLSKQEMSEQWYLGKLPQRHGIDIVALEHFGDVTINYMDAVVHPATTQILLREYLKGGDLFSLKAARYELKEAIQHVNNIQVNRGKGPLDKR